MMTDDDRLDLFERTLESIAAWKDGPDVSRLDEPVSAFMAREAIQKTWPKNEMIREHALASRYRK